MIKQMIKDKKKLIIAIGIIILVIIIITLMMIFNPNNLMITYLNPEGAKFEKAYEKLNHQTSEDGKQYPKVKISADNKMKETNITEILKLFETNGNAVIYFGSPTCIYCRTAVQVLYDTAKDMKLNTIYYLEIEKNMNKYDKLLEVLGSEIIKDNDFEVPLVIFVAEGKIVSYKSGTLFSQADPYQELDESQKQGLSEIYYHGIKDVLEGVKNTNNN